MFQKAKNAVLALGCAALPFLTQVTMSGGSVALESSEVTSIGSAVASGGSSLINIVMSILPIAIGFTIIMLIYNIIGNFSVLKNAFSSDNINTYRKYKKVFGKSRKDYREWKKRMSGK